jgi:hypothetical protein
VARFVAGRRSDGVGQRSQAARAAWVRNVEATRARKAMKNAVIVETMMISRTEKTCIFNPDAVFGIRSDPLWADGPGCESFTNFITSPTFAVGQI